MTASAGYMTAVEAWAGCRIVVVSVHVFEEHVAEEHASEVHVVEMHAFEEHAAEAYCYSSA